MSFPAVHSTEPCRSTERCRSRGHQLLRQWASDVDPDTTALNAVVYGHAMRQLKYEDVPKELALSIARGAVEAQGPATWLRPFDSDEGACRRPAHDRLPRPTARGLAGTAVDVPGVAASACVPCRRATASFVLRRDCMTIPATTNHRERTCCRCT